MREELQRIAVFPIGVGQSQEIAALGGAGIVDENVERVELALDLFDQFCGGVLLAQVDKRGAGAATALGDACGGLVERGAIAPGEHDISALARSASATPRPMPRLDPVTSAIFP